MQAQMRAPAAVLIVWSMVVLFWLVPARFGSIAKLTDKSKLTAKRGIRGPDLEGILEDKANWPAHNYTHLHEQPTAFYAVVVILAIMGGTGFDVLLAWIYVGARIVHSLWQNIVNTIPVRFGLFLISSIALAILGVRAVMATLFADPSAV